MAILDELKARMNEATRSKEEVAKNIYRLAYSEMRLASARSGKDVNDEEAIAILKKLVKSNEETLTVATVTPKLRAAPRFPVMLCNRPRRACHAPAHGGCGAVLPRRQHGPRERVRYGAGGARVR